jgi:hypothetical protein
MPDMAGRIALATLGISPEQYKAIWGNGELPVEMLNSPTVLYRLAVLEHQVRTMEIMVQAMIVLSGVDVTAISETVKELMAAHGKAAQGKEESKTNAQDDTDQAA